MPSTDRTLELQANGINVSARLAAVCVCDGPNEAARLAAVGVCERVNMFGTKRRVEVNIYTAVPLHRLIQYPRYTAAPPKKWKIKVINGS
jgi:hypothetical protein